VNTSQAGQSNLNFFVSLNEKVSQKPKNVDFILIYVPPSTIKLIILKISNSYSEL
jgi:hypothetical protein